MTEEEERAKIRELREKAKGKTCPRCGAPLFYYWTENLFLCSQCNYEEPIEGVNERSEPLVILLPEQMPANIAYGMIQEFYEKYKKIKITVDVLK